MFEELKREFPNDKIERVKKGKQGGDIIVITGTAQLMPEEPPADQLPAFVDKYRDLMRRLNYTPESSAAAYSVAIRVRPRTVRGH